MAISVVADYKDSLDDWFQVGTLKSWQSCVWGAKFGKWSDGKDNRSFWNWLYYWSLRINYLRVYGWDMWRSWCVLGGNKEIADGRLLIDISKDCFVASDPPTIITCTTSPKCRIELVDLNNLGIAKEDFGVFEDNRAILPAAKIAVQDYRSMCKKFDLGKTCVTAATQAWEAFWGHNNIDTIKSPPQITVMEEAAYFGGRCECRRLGEAEETLYHLDVSSLFTSLGMSCAFPVEYIGETPGLYGDNALRIADVTIKTDPALSWTGSIYPARESVKVNRLQPPLPGEYGERIIYPLGEFRTVLCGPELALAEECGHITKWHFVQYYRPAMLMAKWSHWALATRTAIRTDDKLRRLHRCFKTIMNSLPGKWGQYQAEWIDFPKYNGEASEWHREFARNPSTGTMTTFRTIAGQCQYFDKVELAAHSRPAVAAYWTSYGRAMLASLLALLGLDDIYYYDTDSLIVNASGLQTLRETVGISDRAEPGRLRLVGTAHTADFKGIRKYLFGGEWHYAGTLPEGEIDGTLAEQMWKGKNDVASRTKAVLKWNEYKHGTVTEDGIVYPFVIK